MNLRLRVDPDGGCGIEGMSPLLADSLLRIPGWLSNEDPSVRGRLMPEVYSDTAEEQEWRRHASPELEHLFLSRAELVGKDLQTLHEEPAGQYVVQLAPGHATAWLAALNAARLLLFAEHELAPEDMERDPASVGSFEKMVALARIQQMAWLQELLLELLGGW